MSKIEIKNVYKIFGDHPSKVLPMVQDGATKEEILEKTGHTVGLIMFLYLLKKEKLLYVWDYLVQENLLLFVTLID